MNTQRSVIYGFRSEVLCAPDVEEQFFGILDDVVLANAEPAANGAEAEAHAFVEWANTVFPIGLAAAQLPAERTAEALAAAVMDRVRKAYAVKKSGEDPAQLAEMQRQIILHAIDEHWQEYLRSMDALRQGVGLRAYGQRDPLVEYKREAYDMFSNLMDEIKEEVASRMFRASTSLAALQSFLRSLPRTLVHSEVNVLGQAAGGGAPEPSLGDGQPSPQEAAMQAALASAAQPVRRDVPKVGRNDPCPCGSGKKYKKCCGALAEAT
jgi:preprotein translocase subunit SecA